MSNEYSETNDDVRNQDSNGKIMLKQGMMNARRRSSIVRRPRSDVNTARVKNNESSRVDDDDDDDNDDDDDDDDDEDSLADEEIDDSERKIDTSESTGDQTLWSHNSKIFDNSISNNMTDHTGKVVQQHSKSPMNGRRRRRRDTSLKSSSNTPSISPMSTRRDNQHYSQQLAFHSSNLPLNENHHYSQQLAFNNSVMSIDWGSNDSLSSKSERDRKFPNHNASLVFDDELSLSLHQAFIENNESERSSRNSSLEKRPVFQGSAYQLSGACAMVDGILSQLEHSAASPQTSSTRSSESDSESSSESDSSSYCASETNSDPEGGSERDVRLWGREKELYSLRSRCLAAITNLSSEHYEDDDISVDTLPKHVWITGVSGIGKTSLINAFLEQDDFFRRQPVICRGIFHDNWIDASKPFAGLISCFTDLCNSFRGRHDAEEWGERFNACLGDENDIALLASLIPSLAFLLDVEYKTKKYTFDKKDKFLFHQLARALRRILVVTCKYSSVIFTLDDVHWAGNDSLQLLKAILLTNDLTNFFFIGSHRNGLKTSHPLHKVKAEMSTLFGGEIKLGGIDVKSAKSLVRSQLSRLNNDAMIDSTILDSLVKSWYTHSSSRIPIFLEHLVHLLFEKKGFRFKDGKWILDSPKILPSSSPSLVVERIEALPIEYDLILQSAALLDTNDFNIDMLMVAITVIPKAEMLEIDAKKASTTVCSLAEKMLLQEHSAGRYTFTHNVIKVAASSRIPISTKRRRSRLHWRLAKDLKELRDGSLSLKTEVKQDFTGLLIAHHLNKGVPSVEDRKKIEMVGKLYLQVAEAAMIKGAFITASEILETAVTAIDKKSKWDESYVLTLKTHLALARSLYCTNELDKAKSVLNTIIANGRHPRDTVDAFDLLISIYRCKMQYDQSKQFAVKALIDIWDDDVRKADVEEKFSKVRELVQKKSDADLLVLPEMEHKKIAKKMPFLLMLAESSGLCRDYRLQDLAALRMIELTLKYGSYESNYTGLAFALFGLCVERRHLHREAHRCGRLAEMMSEKENPYGRQAIVLYNYHMRHWRNHMKGSRKPLKEICRASVDTNEIENTSFQLGVYLSAIFYTGTPINCKDGLLEMYHQKRKQFELPEYWNVIAPYNALLKLEGQTSKLVKRKYFEAKAVQYDLFFQMVVSVFMNDLEKAEKLNYKVTMKPAGCWGSYRVFMEGLIATHFAISTSRKERYEKKASKFIDVLTTWAKSGMSNSAHMANILNVELKMSSEKHITPKRLSILLDTAIASAYQDGFPHHAALASERAGKYFLHSGDERLASKYLTRASKLYEEWGAIAKVEQLECKYARYLDSDVASLESLKRDNNTPSGTLMFTDKKLDSATQRAARTSARRGSLQHVQQVQRSPGRASRRSSLSNVQSIQRSPGRATRRGSLQYAQPSPKTGRRSLSSDSRKAALKQRDNSPKPIVQNAQSAHSRERLPSKVAKGPRSKSLTNKERPSLIRIGSVGSIKSNISIMSDDKSSSGDKSISLQGRRKKKSSLHSRGVMEEKEKYPSNRSRSPSKSSRRNRSELAKRNPSREQQRTKRNTAAVKTPVPAEKRKVTNGPMLSPNPRRGRFETKEDDWEDRDYLLNYDTDDFDTVNGDSDAIFSPAKKSEKPKNNKQNELVSPRGKDKPPKQPTRRQRRDSENEISSPFRSDKLITPKRKTRTLKSKLISL